MLDATSVDPSRDVTEIPPDCQRYAAGVMSDLSVAWDQLLSFAACVQDASVAQIADPVQLEPVVDQLYDALAPALVLYLEAIEYGPPAIQLRAAYATGMANIALITRLRRSLVAPADWSSAAEVVRYRKLQAALEPLLVRAQRTAWVAFWVIDRAAAQDPLIARDPVTRHAIDGARQMLRVMGGMVRERVRPIPATAWTVD